MSVAPLGVYEWLVRRDVVGLAYHSVSDRRLPHIQGLYDVKSTIAFRRDLEYLRQNYHVAGYSELLAHRLHGAPLPPRSVAITFDDGFAECFSVAQPILAELGLPAMFFVNSDFLDNRAIFYRNKVSLVIERLRAVSIEESRELICDLRARLNLTFSGLASAVAWLQSLGEADESLIDACCAALGVDVADYLARERPYLTRDEVSQMAREGFTIGGHTRRHKRLDRSTQPMVVAREIADSCRDVQDLTGQESVPFAFPFRGPVSRGLLAQIRTQHPLVGLLFDSAGVAPDREFVVQRIMADTSRGAASESSNLSWLFQEARIRRLVGLVRGGAGADGS
jgi:peptidoglycan/xylan/chitin deacetylase (PgdA/CDA1 family)